MKRKIISKNSNYSLAHVLYQKLGKDWYAFTEMDGDCFMTKVEAAAAQTNSHGDLQEIDSRHSRQKRRAA